MLHKYKICYIIKTVIFMSINRELNFRLFAQSEEQQSHVEYRHEYSFYSNVAEGNIEEVQKVLADPNNVSLYESPEYGKLSKDLIRNIRYHFVVSTALITRQCVENGLERELAYTMSDIYIGKMDLLRTAKEIIGLHNEMLLDFTRKMADLPKRQVYSMQVMKAIDYICRSRNHHITAGSVAEKLNINRSYLSTIFKRETGESISDFIRREKLKAAANMLRFSDYSCSDIAEYFGFASQSHFIKLFFGEYGVTPNKYRNRFRR